MRNPFVCAVRSEWLKRKRSLASWLVIVGSLFTPTIVVIARLAQPGKLRPLYAAETFWTSLWKNSWESMAIFFLPMVVILATSLVTQLEFRNRTWKQVHALPTSLATIFYSKYLVVLVMLAQFLLFFNIAIYLSGVLPGVIVLGALPAGPGVPSGTLLKENLAYFIDCLPIVAAQYLLSLCFRNFLVPIGAGFLLWVGALASLSWKFGYVIPYTYPILNYLKEWSPGKTVVSAINFQVWAIGYFALFTIAGFVVFALKNERN